MTWLGRPGWRLSMNWPGMIFDEVQEWQFECEQHGPRLLAVGDPGKPLPEELRFEHPCPECAKAGDIRESIIWTRPKVFVIEPRDRV